MKGIILAGGSGERLLPITRAVSKQLLPVYDKPMIYYPLGTLMRCGIREILVITRPDDTQRFRNLLADGSQWGVSISYAVQESPDGIAQAPLIGAKFLAGDPFALALGDNIFCGATFEASLDEARAARCGAVLFAKAVTMPERYGVLVFDAFDTLVDIVEKPSTPPSRYAVTGLYFYDGQAVEFARSLKPSNRNEIEITDLNNIYLRAGKLSVVTLPESISWLDMGTPDGLLAASELVAREQRNRGARFGVPEQVALANGWIDTADVKRAAAAYGSNDYGNYLRSLVEEE